MKPFAAAPPPRNDRRTGFALVEVLAALVVTGAFVAVALPFAGRLIDRWSAGSGALEAADAWMQAVARIGDDVSQAAPILLGETGHSQVLFRVAPDLVEAVRPSLGGSGRPGLEIVTYRIEQDGPHGRLVRQARPFSKAAAADTSPLDGGNTIIEGSFRLQFSAVDAQGQRADTWNAASSLPARLELAVTGGETGRGLPRRLLFPLGSRFSISTAAASLNQENNVGRSAGNHPDQR